MLMLILICFEKNLCEIKIARCRREMRNGRKRDIIINRNQYPVTSHHSNLLIYYYQKSKLPINIMVPFGWLVFRPAG